MENKISVILPTYNEKGNIVSLIDAVHKELANYNHEIVVVDDNSPDGTYETVKEQNLPYVRALLRTDDASLAKSICCGLENGDGEIFVIMDSDYNHKPQYLPFMVDSMKYYDCAVASRFLYGGMMDSRVRHYLSWLFNIFVRILTKGMITDSLYGYIAIKRKVVEKLDYNKIFWGYGDYCIRLLYYLQKQGVNIIQFPAVNGKRMKGTGNRAFVKLFYQYFTEVLKLVLKETFNKDVFRNKKM